MKSGRILAGLFALAIGAAPAAAQTDNGGFRLAVAAGPTINDFDSSGIDWIWVAGAELRLTDWPVIVVADVRYFTWEPSGRDHLIMPDLGFQFQAALGRFKPFVGLGAGVQYIARPDDSASSFFGHLATGFRVRLTPAVDLRLEMRGRSIDPTIGFTGGFAIGF